jgi:hypothetical protein
MKCVAPCCKGFERQNVDLLSHDIVHYQLFGQRLDDFPHGFLVNRVLLVGSEIRLVGETHDQADIEAIIHYRTLASQRGADAEVLDLWNLLLEFLCLGDQCSAISGIGRLFQPDEDDMLHLTLGSGFVPDGTAGARGEQGESGKREDGDGFLHTGL